MKKQTGRLLSVLAACAVVPLACPAATLYVWQDSPSPTPPYDTWLTAAANIQDAVDAADSGDNVLVVGGVYDTGGRAVVGIMTNRLTIDKAIRVESFMGPEVTLIVGAPTPGGTNGDGAIRCVYLATGATLSGFTLTNGATRGSQTDYQEQSGGGVWCESAAALITNCVLTGNQAEGYGGGSYLGTLDNCTLARNRVAGYGGGAFLGMLSRCTLTDNQTGGYGGGAWSGTLNNCALKGNSADSGGGACSSTLNNSTLTGNQAKDWGGGAHGSTLYNCTVTGNSGRRGGGVGGSSVFNSIVYHNEAPVGRNQVDSTFDYSCADPLPSGGRGNIASDPQLASSTHLSADSPCLGAGLAAYASGLDIDDQPWGNPPCMGADQLVSGLATGPLAASLTTEFTNLTVGFAARFQADVQGQTTGNRWDFGDGTALANRLEAVHAWTAPGTYAVRLTAYNDTHPEGVTATVTVQVAEVPVFYVNQANPNPAFPYRDWGTAATNIQQAIGAGTEAGRVVIVADGVYDTGGVAVHGLMTNRIALTNGVAVRSVNGPMVTVLRGAPGPGGTNGDGAIRCAYVGSGSLLDGFTLTNGHTRGSGLSNLEEGGGGAWGETTAVMTNCVFTGNQAFQDGGGAHGGTFLACAFRDNKSGDDSGGVDTAVLYGCTFTGNVALDKGGGASECILYDCTLATNSAGSGGGACWSTLIRCLVTTNAASDGGGAYSSALDSCTLTTNWADQAGGGAGDSTLTHCTLTGNGSADHGGAAWLATLDHCILMGNSSRHGGGAYGSTLADCILVGNSARRGGGTYGGTLSGCTLTGNSTYFEGGGTYYGNLRNCILHYNTAPYGSNYLGSAFTSCCTMPNPGSGAGNITNAPLFVDRANGNLRLQSNSPCINAGNNSWVTNTTDLDGLPRTISGTVDIGAYEYQGPGSTISYAWLQRYGLPTDGSVDLVDSDGDSHTTFHEWEAGTDPTNAQSCLRVCTVTNGQPVDVTVQSSLGRLYTLLCCTNLAAPSWAPVSGQIDRAGTGNLLILSDPHPPSPAFYRAAVRLP